MIPSDIADLEAWRKAFWGDFPVSHDRDQEKLHICPNCLASYDVQEWIVCPFCGDLA